jgi:hypothetical protein
MFLGELVASWLGSLFWAPGMHFGSIGSLISFITFEVILHTVFGIAMMALYDGMIYISKTHPTKIMLNNDWDKMLVAMVI